MNLPSYSIVVPVYNSESSLEKLFERISAVFSKMAESFEIVFVDDCSRDKSWEVLKKLKSQNNSQVKLVRLARNYGQHNATICGFTHCTAELTITLDDDLQNPPEEIEKLVQQFKTTGADIIYGISDNQHAAYRKAGSRIWKSGTKYLDEGIGEGSPFRLMKTSLAKQICEHRQHFVFIDEIVNWYTSSIEFVKVSHMRRENGKTGYTLSKLFSMAGNLAVFYSGLPLRIVTYGGVMLSFVTFLIGVYFIIKKIFFNVRVEGFTALIVAILFSTSLMLICFGIIGQYISKTYAVLNHKPIYHIKEKLL